MENLELRKVAAKKAYALFNKELQLFNTLEPHDPLYESLRNSAIHTFEFSIDALIKYIKAYLVEVSKLNEEALQSPRSVVKAAMAENIISKEQLDGLLRAYDDRNKTSHTYLEPAAESVVDNCKTHVKLFKDILKQLEETSSL